MSAELLSAVGIVFIFLVPEVIKEDLRHVPVFLGYLMILTHCILWLLNAL
jgi:hypothetical protein